MGRVHAITAGIATLAWCAGCGVGGISSGGADAAPGEVDAGDGGGIPESGVTVEFDILGPNGQPVAGGPLEFEDFTIVQLTMQLHTLQLIGDTAPSGDLVYQSRSMQFPASASIPRVSFAEAPPGIYSRLTFDVERTWADESLPAGFEGARLAVRVVGAAHLSNKDRQFEYVDDQLASIEIGFDEEVVAGIPGIVSVELDLIEWFDGVDWEMLDSQGNPNKPIPIGMGENEETAGILRAALPTSFQVRE
jgi:hypothetical protein